MLTKEENELLTQTGPGTPCGELLRRYWQPVALSEELPPGGAPVPVQVMGEELVLFRDEQGRPGLLGRHCSHRGADLSYGRLEDGGLRCLYHGWLYDVGGRCLEQPGEPAGSTFKDRVRQTAYPCEEKGGLILAYLGPGEPPLLPAYDFLDATEPYCMAVKIRQDCNFMQANEGNLDQVHLSFLHRLSDEALRGTPMGDTAAGSKQSAVQLLTLDVCPRIEVQETSFGMRECVFRQAPEGYYFKIENFVLPNFAAVPGGTQGQDGYLVNWHVPIDDTHHWKYMITFRRSGPLNKERLWSVLAGDCELLPDGRFSRNQDNRYLQNREAMRTNYAFAGLGPGFALHDTWAVERLGAVVDRTQEHLGYEDKSVIVMRKLMFDAIRDVQEGRDPPHVIREPSANRFPELVVLADVLPEDKDWQEYLDERIAERRQAPVSV
jgi:phthalate 4,5-dioxygenase oxygenase subunit